MFSPWRMSLVVPPAASMPLQLDAQAQCSAAACMSLKGVPEGEVRSVRRRGAMADLNTTASWATMPATCTLVSCTRCSMRLAAKGS